jgi:hypothetical protein
MNTGTHELTLTDKMAHFVEQTGAAIEEIAKRYRSLEVTDLTDSETIKAVTKAHIEVKSIRVQIEKTRKDLKADALEWGRTVDSQAKRLTALIQPIEDRLRFEREKPEVEKQRLLAERESADRLRLQERVEKLNAVGGEIGDLEELKIMTPEAFETKLVAEVAAGLQRKHEREIAENLAKIEANRIETERQAEAEKQRAELELRNDQIRQQQAELAELKRQQAERDQAERERLEAEAEKQRLAEQAERERLAEQARQQLEAERVAREEELKPVREQLAKLADKLRNTTVPKSLEEYRSRVQHILEDAAERVRDLV